MICGLEEISSGSLFIDNVYSNDLAPKDRDIAMVFQSYALYPHMSVYDNLAFSLRIRKVPVECKDKDGNIVKWIDKNECKKISKRIKELDLVIKEANDDILATRKEEANMNEHVFNEMINYYNDRITLANAEKEKQIEKLHKASNEEVIKYKYKHIKKNIIDSKVKESAKILEIEPFLTRKPKALSGGQRQRVALGRAIVRDAKVFLMDEPLSNLDAKLRVQMRSELVSLHNRLKATTIYVTHDQTEAMTMADRIVVMKDGVVQQVGTPKEIYDNPRNLFVATFIGAPAMNIIKAKYNQGTISLENGYSFKGEKDAQIKQFYTKEVQRFNDLSISLDNALLDTSDKNIDIYALAKEKTSDLLMKYNHALNGEFEFKFGIRPEHIKVVSTGGMEVRADIVELLGSEYYIHAKIGETSIVFKTSVKREIRSGDIVNIDFDLSESHGFDYILVRLYFNEPIY